jgi:hypothetical protein
MPNPAPKGRYRCKVIAISILNDAANGSNPSLQLLGTGPNGPFNDFILAAPITPTLQIKHSNSSNGCNACRDRGQYRGG